ncbi:MAG: hypothetical protein M1602_02185 [Firmicutes bacterium]|nr:hypothetical protein [Bacillota bacterium]
MRRTLAVVTILLLLLALLAPLLDVEARPAWRSSGQTAGSPTEGALAQAAGLPLPPRCRGGGGLRRLREGNLDGTVLTAVPSLSGQSREDRGLTSHAWPSTSLLLLMCGQQRLVARVPMGGFVPNPFQRYWQVANWRFEPSLAGGGVAAIRREPSESMCKEGRPQ